MDYIPKNFLQVSKKPIPKHIKQMWEKRLSPAWQCFWFDDHKALNFFNENKISEFKDVKDLFHALPCGPQKADLFRYYFLFLKGGIFCDDDLMTTITLDKILQKRKKQFFCITKNLEYLGFKKVFFNGFLGTKPNNEIIYDLLKDMFCLDLNYAKKLWFLPCVQGYENVLKNKKNIKQDFFYEKNQSLDKNDSVDIVDENNSIVATHFYNIKNHNYFCELKEN